MVCLWCPWLLFLCGIFSLIKKLVSLCRLLGPTFSGNLQRREGEREKIAPPVYSRKTFLWTDQNGSQMMPRSVSNNYVCLCACVFKNLSSRSCMFISADTDEIQQAWYEIYLLNTRPPCSAGAADEIVAVTLLYLFIHTSNMWVSAGGAHMLVLFSFRRTHPTPTKGGRSDSLQLESFCPSVDRCPSFATCCPLVVRIQY